MLPRRLSAHATDDPDLPGLEVDVEIEIEQGRARASHLAVTAPDGIGWATLSRIPVRDIVGTAVLTALMRTRQGDGNAILPVPLERSDAQDARVIVQGLVGYRPDLERLEGVAVR
jgi:hypothetical protein